MKFLKLHLTAFGCFTDTSLDFGPDGGALHVILGPNEAGKSTTLRALSGLLYGIAVQSRDNFRHEFKSLRIGAELLGADGRRGTFQRRKGNKDTLLDQDDKKLPDSALHEFLGRVSTETFENVFRLDYASLRQGGDDLLVGKGDLAASLFQAGSGLTGLRHVLAALDAEASQLFAYRSSKALVNRAVSEYDEAEAQKRDLSVKPRKYLATVESLATKEAELRSLDDQMSRLNAEKQRLTRLQLALPGVTLRQTLLSQQSELGDVVLLSESAVEDRKQAERDLREAGSNRDQAEAVIGDLQNKLGQSPVQTELLSQAKTITDLNQRVRSFQDAMRDLPVVRSEQRQFVVEAREILAALHPDLSLDRAETLRLNAIQTGQIRSLAAEFLTLDERERQAARNVETAHDKWRQTQDQLEVARLPPDPSGLKNVKDRIVRRGELEKTLNAQSERLRTEALQADVELRRWTGWPGTLEQLEALSVPELETVERFDRVFESINRELADLDKEIKKIRDRAAQLDIELQTLQLGGSVPSELELNNARTRRDRGWQLIRRAWLDGVSDPVGEAAFSPDQPLPETYEATVNQADMLADRLRREAERVTHQARYFAERQGLDRSETELAKRRQQIVDRTDVASNWQEAWQPAGVDPQTPREMRAWLSRHANLVNQARALREQRQSIQQLHGQIDQCVDELSGTLQSLGEPSRIASESLADLLQRADDTVKRLNDGRKTHSDITQRADDRKREHLQAVRLHEQARDSLSKWRIQWQEAVSPLGLAGEIRPNETNALLDRHSKLFGNLQEAANRDSRVREMEESVRQFQQGVVALSDSLATELRAIPADQAAATLQSMLDAANRAQVLHQAHSKQLADEKRKFDRAVADLRKAQQRLNELMAQARVSDLDSLTQAETRSAQARKLASDLDAVEQRLVHSAAGAPLEQLLNEVASLDADRLPSDIEGLTRDLNELKPRNELLIGDLRSLHDELQKMDGSAQAAAAAEAAQSALATAQHGAEQYIRLRLAAAILRRYLDHYREQNQDPVIARAGELFPRLTLGSFARLKVGFDEKDRPVLLGVRPDGEEVGMEGMSDGTRDQLFLALRLASLERHLSAAEPLPFVVDDILINFDDARASAALQVLAEFAQHTQVLLFTHHTRIRDLAREAVQSPFVTLHELTNN